VWRWSSIPAALAFALTWQHPAAAQERAFETSGKGVAGGALLGGELAAALGTLAGVRAPWAFISTIVVGAAAGSGAGYVVEREAQERASDVLLLAGAALLIPTIVWVGNAREDEPRNLPGGGVAVRISPVLSSSDRSRHWSGLLLIGLAR
jgi:hypothetical protein